MTAQAHGPRDHRPDTARGWPFDRRFVNTRGFWAGAVSWGLVIALLVVVVVTSPT